MQPNDGTTTEYIFIASEKTLKQFFLDGETKEKNWMKREGEREREKEYREIEWKVVVFMLSFLCLASIFFASRIKQLSLAKHELLLLLVAGRRGRGRWCTAHLFTKTNKVICVWVAIERTIHESGHWHWLCTRRWPRTVRKLAILSQQRRRRGRAKQLIFRAQRVYIHFLCMFYTARLCFSHLFLHFVLLWWLLLLLFIADCCRCLAAAAMNDDDYYYFIILCYFVVYNCRSFTIFFLLLLLCSVFCSLSLTLSLCTVCSFVS